MQELFELFGCLFHLRVLPADIFAQVYIIRYGSGNKLSSHAVYIVYGRIQLGKGIMNCIEHLIHHHGVCVIGGIVGDIISVQGGFYLTGGEEPSRKDESCAVAVFVCLGYGDAKRFCDGTIVVFLLCRGLGHRENLPIEAVYFVFT